MNYFITAIGTDSGKTITAAILAEALGADYWKPVQAGSPTDSERVRELVGNHIIIHPERHVLKTPMSPHAAAAREGITIRLEDFECPETGKDLIIEGAGGMLVPLNNQDVVIDLVPTLKAEVILVCNHYLGSINHSLLSIRELQSRGYPLKGIIFNGEKNEETESIILKYANAPCLLRIEQEAVWDKKTIKKYANKLISENLRNLRG